MPLSLMRLGAGQGISSLIWENPPSLYHPEEEEEEEGFFIEKSECIFMFRG